VINDPGYPGQRSFAAKRLGLRYRPAGAGDESVCLLSSTAMSDPGWNDGPADSSAGFWYGYILRDARQ
jgi:hypothetical protein